MAEELYDHSNDSLELLNLKTHPEFKNVLERMRKLMSAELQMEGSGRETESGIL